MLGINPEKVRQVITEARMFDAEEEETDPDSGSNGSDDNMVDVLEESSGNVIFQELAEFIRAMDVDEQIELVALAWLGRGTYTIGEWDAAVAEARRAHNNRTAEYLTSLPMLGDYLEEGLSIVEEAEDEEETAPEA
jgi:hypothetical protein